MLFLSRIMSKMKSVKSKVYYDYVIPMGLTGALIIYFAILREQSFLKTLPTLVTLVVQILMVKVDRRAFLLGGTNSLIYGAAFLSEGIYFTAIRAFCIDSSIQFFTYFNWKKRSKENSKSTELRTLGWKKRAVAAGIILAGWAAGRVFLIPLFESASYPLWDLLLFVMGLVASALIAARYVDAQYISIVNEVINMVLWLLLTIKNPANINYIIISCYNLFRIIETAVSWTREYMMSAEKKE